ncbi:hypothetical protein GS910_29060, partial [Paraburkholderia sp. RL16-012-BIC-B]|uniref:hypothetical protein n=1 Tax=Paraburkholderia madseniana TaxID=2599607 RepID=UPI001A0DA044
MKKRNGDARTLGTSKAVLAIAVSLYAAMAGAQTSSAEPVAQSASSTKLTVAQVLPIDCPLFDTLGCKQDDGGLRAFGGSGVAVAAGLGSTSASGSQSSNGSGTSSTGAGANGSGGGSTSGAVGLG